MDDLTDITKFNATASCSKCTVRRRNKPISDRTTMQFLLNGQFSLNVKSQKANEQKRQKKEKQRQKKHDIQKSKDENFTKNSRTYLYTISYNKSHTNSFSMSTASDTISIITDSSN